MIRFGMVGALGRMGRSIAGLSARLNNFELAAAFEYTKHPEQGRQYGDLTGVSSANCAVSAISAEAVSGLDGIIDFSSPASTLNTLEICVETGIPVVIGTTGWKEDEKAVIRKLSTKIPIVLSSNMSLGVNLLFALTRKAAAVLKDKGFDPEIVEIHHKLKKDAPSGTAQSLKEIILQQYNLSEGNVNYGRSGMVGERPAGEVGVMALRGGDVIGEHDVYFFGEGERLKLSHSATSRDTFAAGALYALQFLQGRKSGLFSMEEALGLSF